MRLSSTGVLACVASVAWSLPWRRAAASVESASEAAASAASAASAPWTTTACLSAVAAVATFWMCFGEPRAPKWLAAAEGRSRAHVLITGGSEGLGKELAFAAAARGADVAIVARTEGKLRAAAEELSARLSAGVANAGRVHAVTGDVTSGESMARAVSNAEAAVGGPVTCVVCCAGGARTGLFFDVDAAAFEAQVRLNYLGVVLALKAVLPGMRDRRAGTAVLVSSGLALCGYAGYSAYAPTKWAVRGLAETLRSELLPFNVAVHSVYPPNMDTPGFAVENLTKPKATVAIEAGEPTHDPKVVAQSILHSLDAGHFNVACGDFGIGLLARAANGLSVRTTLVLDCLTLPVIALIGAVYRRMWDRTVLATKGD